MREHDSEMSFEERHTWAGLVIGLVAIAVYVGVIAMRAQDTPVGDVAWEWPMLWTVLVAGVGYGVMVGLLAARYRGPRRDRRDEEIDRFGELSGKGLLSFTVVVAIVLLAREVDAFWVAHTLFGGSYLASMIGTLAKLAAYRKGLPQ